MAALDPQLDIAWESVEPRSRHRALRRFLRNKLSIVGAVIVMFLRNNFV